VQAFNKLKTLRELERQQLPFVQTVEDLDILVQIGYHAETTAPLTLKQLFLLNIGSAATIQRRLGRLKRLGVVQHKRLERDRRSVELTLNPEVRNTCRRIIQQVTRI
jgi:DNA-binding MarR family transcriptional regulator